MGHVHGLRTPNEGINQRYLKNRADVAAKYAAAIPKNLGLGLNFRPCSEAISSLGVCSPCFQSLIYLLWGVLTRYFTGVTEVRISDPKFQS